MMGLEMRNIILGIYENNTVGTSDGISSFWSLRKTLMKAIIAIISGGTEEEITADISSIRIIVAFSNIMVTNTEGINVTF